MVNDVKDAIVLGFGIALGFYVASLVLKQIR